MQRALSTETASGSFPVPFLFGRCERSIPHGDGQARHLRFATYCCTDNPGNVQTDDPAVPEVPVTGTRAMRETLIPISLPGVRDG